MELTAGRLLCMMDINSGGLQMANHESAVKKHKQDEKKRMVNRINRSKMKNKIKTLHPCPPGKGINIEIDDKNQRIILAGFIRWSKKDSDTQSYVYTGGMGVQLLNYQKPEYQSLVCETY
jgi:hypothetical protein